MNWKQLLNVILTAVACGAMTGLAQHYSDPHAAGTGTLAGSVIAGASVAVVNQLRASPMDGPK